MIFKNGKHYDFLKWFFSVVLPALAALYVGLSKEWEGVISIPYPEQISATIFLVVAFADAILGISSIKYKNLSDEEKRELEEYKEDDDEQQRPD